MKATPSSYSELIGVAKLEPFDTVMDVELMIAELERTEVDLENVNNIDLIKEWFGAKVVLDTANLLI